MSDEELVKRLTAFVAMSKAMGNNGTGSKLAAESAATIERLTKERDRAREMVQESNATVDRWYDSAVAETARAEALAAERDEWQRRCEMCQTYLDNDVERHAESNYRRGLEARIAELEVKIDEVDMTTLDIMRKPMTLREANVARQREWDPGGHANNMPWRLNELGGEVGEVCNILKKLHRERMGVPGSRATKDQLAEELADVVICIDLAAMEARIDADAVAHWTVCSRGTVAASELTDYGVALFICLGVVCEDRTSVDFGRLQAMIYDIASREKIDLDRAVAEKFNATSAKVGLETQMDYGDGVARY